MFAPAHESDDEATIDKEERDMEKVTHTHTHSLTLSNLYTPISTQEGEVDYSSEIRQLEAEGEIPIMDLIASLPSEITSIPPTTLDQGEEQEEKEMEEEEGEKEKEQEGPPSPVKRVTRSVCLIYQ